jgi:hypothetical protein
MTTPKAERTCGKPRKWEGTMWAVPYKGAIISDGYGWLARLWPGWWTKAEAMWATNQHTEGDERTTRRVHVTMTPIGGRKRRAK